MGWQDIKRRYRRSLLGPFWLTLTLAALVTAIGLLYGRLMGQPLDRYVPHVALGFIAWQFISGVLSEGCQVFVSHAGWIRNLRLPLSTFVYKTIWQHLLMMAHNALVYLGVLIIFGIVPGWAVLLVVPALAVIVLNGTWAALLLGLASARFRDIPPIVQSILRVVMFVTPILWIPSQLGARAHLALYNPFAYFVELLRAPLLGAVPSQTTWALALAVTGVGWVVTLLFFAKFRSRVAYWL